MNLSNNFYDIDDIKILRVNKKYFKILLIMIFMMGALMIIKKDYYYENNILIDNDDIILIVEKDVINKVRDKKNIIVNKIKSDYSINKIIDQGNICYVDINLNPNIENISNTKYKILLGKETIFEYIVRIIKKIS